MTKHKTDAHTSVDDSNGQHVDDTRQGRQPQSARPSAANAVAHFGLAGSFAEGDAAGLAAALSEKEHISPDEARKRVDAYLGNSSN